jgi:serine/threonine protein kinase
MQLRSNWPRIISGQRPNVADYVWQLPGGRNAVAQTIVQPLRRWDPERIGRYTIIGKLGSGAMGQVFLARSVTGRLVAVKAIRVELAEEPGFRARFAREVAAASRVSGVFTAAVIEADPEADRPWVATAYVPAPSLSKLVRQCGPLPVPAVRWLAAGCAEALQSIHSAGLLHRDVKPSNVLVAPDGPRVIDFGVARAAERVQLTASRGAAGTPAYMAPEQARDAGTASPASDIFSLGATLVFAATGHPPYPGETVMDILVRLATEPPDLTGLPDELIALVTSCLDRVPRNRPTDGAILAALGPFAHPVQAGHSYLPGSAMALIDEYQYSARPPADRLSGGGTTADDDSTADDDAIGGLTNGSGGQLAGDHSAPDDPTSGSHTALPGFESPAALYAGPDGPQSGAGQQPPARQPPAQPGEGRGLLRARSRWAWAIAAGAAVALLAAGTGLGLALGGPGASAAGTQSSCTTPVASSTPQLCVTQPYGDSDTVFVIHGNGFSPFTQLTIRIVGNSASEHPTADRLGTFNYAIDQGHRFFSGPIPPTDYHVIATDSGGHSATVSFLVSPPDGPPPGGGPSPGSGPPPGGGGPPPPGP